MEGELQGTMADDKTKLAGHRKAIEEHIAKYEHYSHDQDKQYALKTIRRIQSEIRAIRNGNSHLAPDWQDDWDVE